MSSQDNVLLVIGSWVRDKEKKWYFDPDILEVNGHVQLYSGMTDSELVVKVRERLLLRAHNISIKLSYQFPEWMRIDAGDGSTPQYIIDDHEVEIFLQMRRKIEDVNLFVTVFKHVSGVKTILHPTPALANMTSDGTDDDADNETDEEWDAFAMSDTPLTIPTGTEQGTTVVLGNRRQCGGKGITIREPEHITRLASQSYQDAAKGKGKQVGSGGDTDSDDDEYPVVPSGPPPKLHGGESSRRVNRQLFPPPLVAVTAAPAQQVTDATDGDEQENVGDEPQTADEIVWSRFQQELHKMLSDATTESALFGRDAPPVFNDIGGDGVDSALSDVAYEGDKLFVGRVFKSKLDCKMKIAIHAINRKFHFRTSRSTPHFMVLKCVCRSCPWRIYAVMLDESGNFQIRQATLEHSCTVDDRRNYHKLATTQVIGEIMQSRFVGIKKGPNPSSIQKLLLDDYNVNVSYWKAWRAREVAMENSLGSIAGSYALLPAYLSLLQTANPGTLCSLEHVEDPAGGRRFKYCFVAYGASVKGYTAMRKVIVIDGTSLKGRYGGCLVSACAQDGNYQIFPLAFGIVDSENDAAWEWFLQKLSTFVHDSSELVFISDRHASIYTSLRRVYPTAHHAACTVHLGRNVRSLYKPKRIGSLLSDAARAFTIADFNRKFLEIQRMNPGCAAYLVDIGFEHWTRAHFKGQRYNIMDSNISESWNAVLKEAREYPLICMFEYIRTTIMGWFASRRAKANREIGTLTPKVRALVEGNFEASTSMAVSPICDFEFQVQEQNGECFTVKLLAGTCTCMVFQELRIPCPHAVAAASRIGLPTDSMVAFPYFVETWRAGFDLNIYPVPSVGGAEVGGGTTTELMPPHVRRPPGRPRKIRILSRGEFKRPRKKSNRRCTRCRKQGHNKASCRNPI